MSDSEDEGGLSDDEYETDEDNKEYDESDPLPSDIDFNFDKMKKFPSTGYATWKERGRSYNNGYGGGSGEPMPKYEMEKIIVNHIKFMTFTLYNNGQFNHRAMIITRERNKLIDNEIRLELCKLINLLGIKKESMDYRYHRKIQLTKYFDANKDKIISFVLNAGKKNINQDI